MRSLDFKFSSNRPIFKTIHQTGRNEREMHACHSSHTEVCKYEIFTDIAVSVFV